ncbi:hypothetical protein WN51_02389 [Melipona quadrifasciata]|uniref:Uncharacterized protein n=1 Tax=Melipona quadrifasciata TaxID=166423 RepID=A0A0M8ZUP7_9HYME|nr:hypothetical protein WN51_02389 [Melipona quadrifasciata]
MREFMSGPMSSSNSLCILAYGYSLLHEFAIRRQHATKGQPRNKDIRFFLSNEHNFGKLLAVCRKTRRKRRDERRGKGVSGEHNLACDHIPGSKAATDTNVPPCAVWMSCLLSSYLIRITMDRVGLDISEGSKVMDAGRICGSEWEKKHQMRIHNPFARCSELPWVVRLLIVAGASRDFAETQTSNISVSGVFRDFTARWRSTRSVGFLMYQVAYPTIARGSWRLAGNWKDTVYRLRIQEADDF